MKFRITRNLYLFIILMATALPSTPVFASDPFYQNLLFKGTATLRTGEPARAVETLRLACFGFLDEPENLAGCLVQLALAEDASDQQEEFTATFHRLIEIEQRFGAYTSADIDDATREKLKAAVQKRIPKAVLDEAKLFVGKK